VGIRAGFGRAALATVSTPDAMLGEVLGAFVVTAPGAALGEEEFSVLPLLPRENLFKYQPASGGHVPREPAAHERKELDKKALRALARRPSN
jgi:hypothetical protein